MPRKFQDNPDDKIIYDEEEDVLEMYFFTKGMIGVGFKLISNGLKNDTHSIAKKLYAGPP